MINSLEKDFYYDVQNLINESKKIGYNPTRFIKMLKDNNNNAVFTVRRIISKEHVTDGFTNMCLKNRLDLTIENLVINEKYKELFTEDEINKCKSRLK